MAYDFTSVVERRGTACVKWDAPNGAGIPAPANLDEAPALYSLALNSLTLHYYDHRDATEAAVPIPLGLRLIINQLKQSSDGFF